MIQTDYNGRIASALSRSDNATERFHTAKYLADAIVALLLPGMPTVEPLPFLPPADLEGYATYFREWSDAREAMLQGEFDARGIVCRILSGLGIDDFHVGGG